MGKLKGWLGHSEAVPQMDCRSGAPLRYAPATPDASHASEEKQAMKWEWSDFGFDDPREPLARALEALTDCVVEFHSHDMPGAISRLVSLLIDEAVQMEAREIELRKCDTHVATYFRVKESLIERDSIPLGLVPGVVGQLKNLCKQREEDRLVYGEFWFPSLELETEIRVIVLSDDEKILLRLDYEK